MKVLLCPAVRVMELEVGLFREAVGGFWVGGFTMMVQLISEARLPWSRTWAPTSKVPALGKVRVWLLVSLLPEIDSPRW